MTLPLPIVSAEFLPHNPPPPQGHVLLTIVEDWVARLITDPKSKPSQVLNALRRLELMREFPMRQAVAAAKIELQRRSMAHREGLRQDRLADKAEKQARQAAKEAAAAEKAATPRKTKAKSVARTAESTATQPVSNKNVEEPMPAEEASEESPGTPQTTEQLHAMEWDLRSMFDFGDLRPFEFCTGTKIVRFPDRSHGQPQINYPVGFKSTSDTVPRGDEYLILPHALPPGFEISAKVRREPKSSTRLRSAPVYKEGHFDWSHFVKPLTTGIWPDNAILPQDWQYGDPIPGMPEDAQ